LSGIDAVTAIPRRTAFPHSSLIAPYQTYFAKRKSAYPDQIFKPFFCSRYKSLVIQSLSLRVSNHWHGLKIYLWTTALIPDYFPFPKISQAGLYIALVTAPQPCELEGFNF
jgi:hypothetical protein